MESQFVGYAEQPAPTEEPLTYRLDCTTGRIASQITDLCSILDRALGGSVINMGTAQSGNSTLAPETTLRSVLSNLEHAEKRLSDQVCRARALA